MNNDVVPVGVSLCAAIVCRQSADRTADRVNVAVFQFSLRLLLSLSLTLSLSLWLS